MMIDTKRAVIALALLGLIIGFVLWAFALIPWWAIFLGALAGPIGAAIIVLIFAILWTAGGSH